MGTYEDFMKAWNYIWAMGNEVIEYSPFLAERDVPKTDSYVHQYSDMCLK